MLSRLRFGARMAGLFFGFDECASQRRGEIMAGIRSGRARTTEADGPAECTVCGFRGRFYSYGSFKRKRSKCPGCGAIERHRLLALAIDRVLDLDGAELLHFAPEASMSTLLQGIVRTYQTADLNAENVDHRVDIENMDLPDDTYSHLVCVHVLEHVDDAAALKEMYRILRPGGAAVLMVPIIEGWDTTFEDPSITSEVDRERYFGQYDHVRYYGRDFRDRVTAAGFELSEFFGSPRDCYDFALSRGERVFIARKPSS